MALEFRCRFCPDEFATVIELVSHVRTHTSISPSKNQEKSSVPPEEIKREQIRYPCDICDATFSVRRHMTKHKVDFHENLNRPEFKCELCEKNL